ncbi:hypothetical protein H0X09_03615 [Candidatus Saccharibacteria bacterium]|nr:hypothetical protein [Candidatus Saccharibacteria bacterium]
MGPGASEKQKFGLLEQTTLAFLLDLLYYLAMFEMDPSREAGMKEKADQWLNDVKSELEKLADPLELELGNAKFLVKIDRGMLLSERRVALFAELQDRREAFFGETGADPLLEQFYAFRSALDADMQIPS